MTTLIKHAPCGKADYQRIADFLNFCEAATYREEFTTVEALDYHASRPGFDPQHDECLWETTDGQLLGIAGVGISPEPEGGQIDGYFYMTVHPAHRGALEPEMLGWAEARLRQVGQMRGYPTQLYVYCRDTALDRLELFQRLGFAEERKFLTETRSLLEPIAAPQLPDGFRLVSGRINLPLQDCVDLYNQTFIDHWNFHPTTVERLQHWLNDPDYRPDLDLIAVAPDGALAGFCYCYIDGNSNTYFAKQEGWIASLGTRRGYRRLGLGRSLLLAGLHTLKTAGMDTALLGVDTQNPNCAYALYHSVGFSPKLSHLTFRKTIE